MSNFETTRFVIFVALAIVILAFFISKDSSFKNKISTKFIARTGIFAAISIILYIVPYFNFGLPFFPSFLKLHFDEVPAFIAGFAYGPLSAFFIILVKTLVKLPLTSTMGVGELADLIYSCAFVIPAALVYKKRKTLKGAMLSFGVATLSQLVVSCFVTTFLIINFYIYMMGWSRGFILSACQMVNKNITSLDWPFMFYAVLPFNAMKDAIVVVVTMVLYKRLHRLIDRI